MSDILPLSIGVLPTHNHYGLRNTQALAGVSHVWQDFFARALAEQLGETSDALAAKTPAPADPSVEPREGADLLAQILTQRECDVKDTEIAPPEPLFLPIAEFETELLPPAATPFPEEEVIAQQRQQAFESEWVRPIVLNAGQPLPEPGPAPQPRPLHLPIAEFELDLLPPAAVPFPEDEIVAQQRQQNFESGWVRPIVLTAGQPLPEPGPAPQPKPLFLPIAEFELDLLPPAATPYPEEELLAQQKALDFDYYWARPLVTHNLRLAA